MSYIYTYIYGISSLRVNVHGSVHRYNMLVHKTQQDAQVTEIILSDNCSTCSTSATIAADNSMV